MKGIGLALLVTTLSSVACAASGYSETWNPPEPRATSPYMVNAAHKQATHRHIALHATRVHVRHARTSSRKLMAQQHLMQQVVPTEKPDMSAIPRQVTPEGNVLRVSSHGLSMKVER